MHAVLGFFSPSFLFSVTPGDSRCFEPRLIEPRRRPFRYVAPWYFTPQIMAADAITGATIPKDESVSSQIPVVASALAVAGVQAKASKTVTFHGVERRVRIALPVPTRSGSFDLHSTSRAAHYVPERLPAIDAQASHVDYQMSTPPPADAGSDDAGGHATAFVPSFAVPVSDTSDRTNTHDEFADVSTLGAVVRRLSSTQRGFCELNFKTVPWLGLSVHSTPFSDKADANSHRPYVNTIEIRLLYLLLFFLY
jgi:hypothetical protein